MTLTGWLTPPHGEPGPELLRIRIRREGETATVACAGELDVTTGGRFLDAVEEACDGRAAHLRLDLAGVEFVDSTGLRCLLRAHDRAAAAGAAVELVASAQLQRLLDLSGVRIG
jgi:anti-sigma B factor antagonist